MQQLTQLNDEIISMPSEASRATLDHKIKKRQILIVELFERFKSELNNSDIKLLESIASHSASLIKKVEEEKDKKINEIIKTKSSKTRTNLYTSISKQK